MQLKFLCLTILKVGYGQGLIRYCEYVYIEMVNSVASQ
jgi:hypothetical protein